MSEFNLSEIELDRYMKSRLVIEAASRPHSWIPTANTDQYTYRALTLWLALQTTVWLKEQELGSLPFSRVERIWSIRDGAFDVDMRAIIKGENIKFKVTTARLGSTERVRLRIQPWNRAGRPLQIWERIGEYHGGAYPGGSVRTAFLTLHI